MHRWKIRDKVSSGGISTESNAVRRCACSFDGKQAGKEDQQCNDDRMARSKCWSNSIWSFDYRDFGYRELEMSRTPTIGVPKSRNAKSQYNLNRWIKENLDRRSKKKTW
jgi:hypothetical protein